MSRYLKRHAYSNAKTVDLWAALGEAAGQKLEGVMATWTGLPGEPAGRGARVVVCACMCLGSWRVALSLWFFAASGFPLLSVDTTGAVTQSRFLGSGAPTAEQDSNLWRCALCAAVDVGVVETDALCAPMKPYAVAWCRVCVWSVSPSRALCPVARPRP